MAEVGGSPGRDSRRYRGSSAPAVRFRRALEFATLFGALPWLYRLGLVPLPVLPALWLVAAGCLAVLLASPGFDRRRLWNADRAARRCLAALGPVALVTPLLVGLTVLLEPGRLLRTPVERPLLWAAVLVLYPILSVYPQGIVYRAFIFHRYRRLFPGRWPRILASAVAFCFVHVVFENWLAPALTLGGGLLFAWTYERTRSLLVTAIQHAALGCLVFTLGLGGYFYKGLIGVEVAVSAPAGDRAGSPVAGRSRRDPAATAPAPARPTEQRWRGARRAPQSTAFLPPSNSFRYSP